MTKTELIDHLNKLARRAYVDASSPTFDNASRSLSMVASASGLELVAESNPQQFANYNSTQIYRTPEGDLINCWLIGPQSSDITEGGAGFDDQVEWYTEREDQR